MRHSGHKSRSKKALLPLGLRARGENRIRVWWEVGPSQKCLLPGRSYNHQWPNATVLKQEINSLVVFFSGLLISCKGHPLSKLNQKQARKEVLGGSDNSGQPLRHWKEQRTDNCSGLEECKQRKAAYSESFILISKQNATNPCPLKL